MCRNSMISALLIALTRMDLVSASLELIASYARRTVLVSVSRSIFGSFEIGGEIGIAVPAEISTRTLHSKKGEGFLFTKRSPVVDAEGSLRNPVAQNAPASFCLWRASEVSLRVLGTSGLVDRGPGQGPR
jgi:hypothetical protein